MAFIDDPILASEIEPSTGGGSFTLIPKGTKVELMVVESDYKPNSKNNGKVIHLKYEVISGTYKHAMFKGFYNYENLNATAQEIGRSEISAHMHAIGREHERFTDTHMLHNRPFVAELDVEDSVEKKTLDDGTIVPKYQNNRIKKYFTRDGKEVVKSGTSASGVPAQQQAPMSPTATMAQPANGNVAAAPQAASSEQPSWMANN